MSIKAVSIVAGALLIAGMLLSAFSVYNSATDFETINMEIANKSQMKDKLLGIFRLGNSKEIRALTEMADYLKYQTMFNTIYFFGLSSVFIGLAAYVKNPAFLCGALLLTAFIALIVGLSAPIISVVIYKDLPFVGHAVIQFESRGVISSIDSLWAAGHCIIASAIFIFSIAVPITKTFAMGLVIIMPQAPASKKLLNIFKAIGKWSMTDVFVVALMISLFSFSNGKSTDAAPQIGIYYFLLFVILSMAAAYKFPKCLTQRPENTAPYRPCPDDPH